ncbi:MAG: murein biosynthesis integral membrane protein MurJ [Pseudomonadota bacterium]
MGLFGKFSIVGMATLASRFLGFFREAIIAAVLGAGPVADAFYAAFRFPNLFRRLFAEGAFNSAFIPLFAKELEGGGKQAAREFCEQVLSVLLCVLLGLSALAMIFMPFLVDTIIAARFDPASEKFEITTLLARIMFPYLTAMSLVAMLSGVLNSFRRYFIAAIAPTLLNIVVIGGLLIALYSGMDSRQTGIMMAWSVTVSGVLQLCLLIYGVHREGFAVSLRAPALTKPVKRLLVLAIPAAITGGITQINLLVGQNIASAQDGAIAIINYADRLFQLPLGVVAVAITVVLLPELSRALKADDLAEAAKLQNKSLEFGLLLTIPAAVAFAIMPEALLALVFERGAFTRQTTIEASAVLLHFGWGLPAATLISTFRPGFYAREDMRTPMWFAAANVTTNIAVSLTLFPIIGIAGIAIATSIAQWLNAILLGATLWWRGLFVPSGQTLRNLALIIFANVVMALVLWLAVQQFGSTMLDGSLITRIALIFGTIIVCAGVYFSTVLATGAVDRDLLTRSLRRKPRSEASDKDNSD